MDDFDDSDTASLRLIEDQPSSPRSSLSPPPASPKSPSVPRIAATKTSSTPLSPLDSPARVTAVFQPPSPGMDEDFDDSALNNIDSSAKIINDKVGSTTKTANGKAPAKKPRHPASGGAAKGLTAAKAAVASKPTLGAKGKPASKARAAINKTGTGATTAADNVKAGPSNAAKGPKPPRPKPIPLAQAKKTRAAAAAAAKLAAEAAADDDEESSDDE